ncbi:NAD-dependent histone deacetylase SIR2 [Trichinella pseudospiralis]
MTPLQCRTLKRFCCFSVRSQALQYARWLRRDAPKPSGPLFNSFQDITGPLLRNAANNLLGRLQTSANSVLAPKSTVETTDPFLSLVNKFTNDPAPKETSLFDGFSSGKLPGIAPIPVPGFPGPQEVPQIPGVNTIPGLDSFNYLVGQLLPQSVLPMNHLLGGTLNRVFPKTAPKNLAQGIFQKIAPDAARLSVESMMGRWFQVITSPHVLREACAVSHFGALTNNTYSATFTILKFYREGNIDGPPRFSLGYGFKIGENGTFNIHNSNSPDTEPFTVVKVGPLNDHNQYDYAIVSNWVKFPVFVIARNPERFQRWYMREVLEYLEKEKYINFITKALNLIAPVDYAECQYTPTFSSAG